jgi:hypothetical protein
VLVSYFYFMIKRFSFLITIHPVTCSPSEGIDVKHLYNPCRCAQVSGFPEYWHHNSRKYTVITVCNLMRLSYTVEILATVHSRVYDGLNEN